MEKFSSESRQGQQAKRHPLVHRWRRRQTLSKWNLVFPVQKPCKEPCGGFYPSISTLQPERSAASCFGEMELQRNPVQDSHEKLVWVNESGTNSQENGHQQAFLPKIYATSTVRCPIKLYKLFQNHWPKEMRQPDSPFFFCCQTRQSSWRKRNMVHEITTRKKSNWAIPFCSSRQCRHSKNWSSNHSVSKTSISRLLDASTP